MPLAPVVGKAKAADQMTSRLPGTRIERYKSSVISNRCHGPGHLARRCQGEGRWAPRHCVMSTSSRDIKSDLTSVPLNTYVSM